ncbi:hypothetical protein P175DRAFT_0535286 [Aspergillus ochraceoroseus IBT 24754]|uniref:Complex 1 LYR protein domain-containing protein n=3 Tax=Aspergillus subgen. Nidulantes TaxID=2720870 RepID=A0A0F8WSM8_9EURO|nr:uncharacterized protein P175DRAFT_0535286 [Aspergillus ochraceoroseus IBT 24754]KKK14250.1 hypothetical protein AOCH_001432 [Aspergillus ochraceoroseus]KKK20630.1 hypothetical protein ARAM_000175 [Aspergillus rambellii]PTU18366.1 hypothetical protein P175DRAFT_0535286 [Aspergillus ochraceoroseus IBT 24754]
MHKVVAPKFSSIHGFACRALYRALLRQCNKLPSTAPTLVAVTPHVRDRFRRYKNLQSPSQTANALKAGYEALDLLHSASQGNQGNSQLIRTILAESQSIKEQKSKMQMVLEERSRAAKKARKPSEKEKKREESRRFQEMTESRHPDTASILSRPRPVVNGRRHVPVLINARGVPYLRIKKPQPKILSGIIRTKLAKRWKRIERRERLETELLFGQDEDHWDRLTIGQQPETWASEIASALQETREVILSNDTKNRELAVAMWNVVLAERKLAEEEKPKSAET